MWQNPEARRQTLLFAFLFSLLNVAINNVRVAPFFLEPPALLPETACIKAFAIRQFFREIGAHVAPDLFDLDNGALYRLLVGKGKFLHPSQEGDDAVHTLIQQKKTFIDTQLRGTCGRLLEKRGTDTFITNRVAGARLRSPGPLRTVRESFPSHSSSLSNASKETRLRNGETLAMDRAVALWMKQNPILGAGGTT